MKDWLKDELEARTNNFEIRMEEHGKYVIEHQFKVGFNHILDIQLCSSYLNEEEEDVVISPLECLKECFPPLVKDVFRQMLDEKKIIEAHLDAGGMPSELSVKFVDPRRL